MGTRPSRGEPTMDEPAPAAGQDDCGSSEPIATEEMCRYCFDVLLLALETPDVPPPPPPFGQGVSCPLFITWNKRNRRGKQLRGCIGNLRPMPLEQIASFVYKSAFQDQRFRPIEQHELEQLECGVSLLVHYEEANGAFDWEVGTHGVLIDFLADNRNYGATYLPEVASEQGWTQQEAIESLMRKAGYRGRIDERLLRSIRLTRYQSSKWKLSYEDWLPLKGATLG